MLRAVWTHVLRFLVLKSICLPLPVSFTQSRIALAYLSGALSLPTSLHLSALSSYINLLLLPLSLPCLNLSHIGDHTAGERVPSGDKREPDQYLYDSPRTALYPYILGLSVQEER